MKIKFKLLLFGLCLLAANFINAQTRISSLKIGDKIPDIVLSGLLGQPKPVHLSELHDQDLLIINFWATWCVPCVRELPKLDSLAAAYPGKLKVLSVAYEPEQTVTAFFKKHPDIPKSHLLIAMGDKVLVEYFRHQVQPHNIWIDKNGIVKNITGEEDMTAENVERFFNNKLETEAKIDHPDFDSEKTFHLKDSDFLYRSILTGYTAGILGGFDSQMVWHHPTERWFIRFFAFNGSKQQLLFAALKQLQSFKDYYQVMRIETKDSTRFFWPEQCPQSFKASKYRSRSDWKKTNLYCYELTLPEAAKDSSFFSMVQNDLQRVFRVDISVKKEQIPTCVLTLDMKNRFERPLNDSSYIELSRKGLKVHNVTLLHLFNFLNENVKPDLNAKPADPPFVDETGIGHRVDLEIELTGDNPTYAQIKAMIASKYGIHTELKEREYPIIVVKDLVP